MRECGNRGAGDGRAFISGRNPQWRRSEFAAADTNARGEMERLDTADLQPRAAAHNIDGNVTHNTHRTSQALGWLHRRLLCACVDERVRR